MEDQKNKLNGGDYKKAVHATLAYFDCFEYPLTFQEMCQYLLKVEPDKGKIQMALRENTCIKKQGSYYQLRTSRDHDKTRKERAVVAKGLWKKVNRYRWIFESIPYVRVVAICNTLAINNTSKNSDIDLFIITQEKRLFTSRLILTFWLHLLGIRRHGKKVAGRFCLSFFITENHLSLESICIKPQDIYLAYWIRTLQPITGSLEVYEKFMNANRFWLNKFFIQNSFAKLTHYKKPNRFLQKIQNLQEIFLNTSLGEKIETHLESWQLKRATAKRTKLPSKNPRTGVIVSKEMLKFHNKDRREIIFKEWQNRINRIRRSA